MSSRIKKLSIGIPTYNNPTGLKGQLDFIISEIKEAKVIAKDIEILVSDNSEGKATLDMITENFLGITDLKYIKNSHNIGFDRNVDQLLEKTEGAFCWILSDNDLLKTNSIKEIIETLDKNVHDVAHIIIDSISLPGGLQIYKNMEVLMQEKGFEIPGGLISRNIFSRKHLPKDRSLYYCKDWIHLFILFDTCCKHKVALISEVFISSKDEECRWAKNGKTFKTYTNLRSLFTGLKNSSYSKAFLTTMDKKFVRGLPHQVVTAKIHGLKANRETLQTLYTQLKSNKIIFMICALILITPKSFLEISKKIWRKL